MTASATHLATIREQLRWLEIIDGLSALFVALGT